MYTMALKTEGAVIALPVLPEKLEVASPGKNDRETVLVLRDKGLRSVAWEGLFPAGSAPYVIGGLVEPMEAVRAIQAARDGKKPIRFILAGTDLDVNTEMGVDSFDYEEWGGEVGDVYYSIKLTEWKSYGPRRLTLPAKAGEAAAVQEPERAGAPEPPEPPGRYTVVKGETLWAVARKSYGDGGRWRGIYDANRAVIGANPKLIYPGQVLTIP